MVMVNKAARLSFPETHFHENDWQWPRRDPPVPLGHPRHGPDPPNSLRQRHLSTIYDALLLQFMILNDSGHVKVWNMFLRRKYLLFALIEKENNCLPVNCAFYVAVKVENKSNTRLN